MLPETKQWAPLQFSDTPFQHIGLAFSGGGFRAATYGLGILSYLNEVLWNEPDLGYSLLQSVTYMSSASGGTITTAMYALNSAEGKQFGDYYALLFENLDGVCLLDEVFRILNDDNEWKDCPHKQRNLINAFSIAYDNKLFSGKRGEDLVRQNPANHLDEVCFNTTDFYRGLLFRQSIKMKHDKEEPGFLYGNFMLNLSHGMAAHLKLADMLAASSCFPAGFEPIVFPGDFVNSEASREQILEHLCVTPRKVNSPELQTVYSEAATNSIINYIDKHSNLASVPKTASLIANASEPKDFSTGFMDGGITDNQGIESLLNANDRREKGKTDFKPFDFMMVNDVGSPFMDPYMPEKENKSYTGISGITVNTVLILSAVTALVGLSLLLYAFFGPAGTVTGKVCAAIGIVLLNIGAIVFGGIQLLKRFIRGRLFNGSGLNLDKNFSRSIVSRLFRYFGNTPAAVILIMLKERFNSILMLNNDVFMDRIRELLYQKFLDEGRRKFRVKTNHIYDLSFANDGEREKNDPPCLAPSYGMQNIAQNAYEMATTLWFDTAEVKDDMRAVLIACGQFTTCYNLLVYIERMFEPSENGGIPYFYTLSLPWREKILALHGQMMEHYNSFRTNPYWLYVKLGTDSKKPYPAPPPVCDKLPEAFIGLRKRARGSFTPCPLYGKEWASSEKGTSGS